MKYLLVFSFIIITSLSANLAFSEQTNKISDEFKALSSLLDKQSLQKVMKLKAEIENAKSDKEVNAKLEELNKFFEEYSIKKKSEIDAVWSLLDDSMIAKLCTEMQTQCNAGYKIACNAMKAKCPASW